jgi:hypothetical protein
MQKEPLSAKGHDPGLRESVNALYALYTEVFSRRWMKDLCTRYRVYDPIPRVIGCIVLG